VARAAGVTAEQLREMELYRERQRDAKRQPNEQLEEELTIRVTIAADAAYGRREVRLVDEAAISNPLWIHVGQYPEVQEVEPNDVAADRSVDVLPGGRQRPNYAGGCGSVFVSSQDGPEAGDCRGGARGDPLSGRRGPGLVPTDSSAVRLEGEPRSP
jgi:hypothetical protein